jgi:hypothetical protein
MFSNHTHWRTYSFNLFPLNSLESGIINPILAAVYGALFFLPVGPTRFAALRCMSVVLSQSCVSKPVSLEVYHISYQSNAMYRE